MALRRLDRARTAGNLLLKQPKKKSPTEPARSIAGRVKRLQTGATLRAKLINDQR
jgi:hypothetical protein